MSGSGESDPMKCTVGRFLSNNQRKEMKVKEIQLEMSQTKRDQTWESGLGADRETRRGTAGDSEPSPGDPASGNPDWKSSTPKTDQGGEGGGGKSRGRGRKGKDARSRIAPVGEQDVARPSRSHTFQ